MHYIFTMTEKQPKNVGGRPKLPDSERGKNHSIRITDARWAKLKRLGMAWLNRTIDRAKEPDKE